MIPDQEVPELLQQALQMEAVVQKSFGLVMFDLQKVLMDVRTHLRFRRMFYEWLDVYLAALEERGVVPVHIEDKDDQMVPVAGYLDILPWNQNYSVESIALDLGISASQLNRSFRKRYGQTIKQYRESRLEEAARSRLCMSEDSIKSISYDLGFSSPSHFIAWFRKRTGRSPGEVREGSSGGD